MNEYGVLVLVRHGETSANLERVWHGSIDAPLTERGARQADRVAAYLTKTRTETVALYASPLRRARQTADAIGARLGLETRIEPDLREYHLGRWEGKTYEELATRHRLFERMQADPDLRFAGGESARGVAERLASALRRIADAHGGERVVVVTHGGALTLGLGLILDRDPAVWRRAMTNCAVSELALAPEPRLLSFNQEAHLDGV